MKKLLLSVSMAAVGLLAFAHPKEKNGTEIFTYPVEQKLELMYGELEDIRWSRTKDDLVRADFSVDGESMAAFFDQENNYVATTSYKKLEALPAVARKSIQGKFKGREIGRIVHYTSQVEEAYYLEFQEAGKTKVFRVTPLGGISRFQ